MNPRFSEPGPRQMLVLAAAVALMFAVLLSLATVRAKDPFADWIATAFLGTFFLAAAVVGYATTTESHFSIWTRLVKGGVLWSANSGLRCVVVTALLLGASLLTFRLGPGSIKPWIVQCPDDTTNIKWGSALNPGGPQACGGRFEKTLWAPALAAREAPPIVCSIGGQDVRPVKNSATDKWECNKEAAKANGGGPIVSGAVLKLGALSASRSLGWLNIPMGGGPMVVADAEVAVDFCLVKVAELSSVEDADGVRCDRSRQVPVETGDYVIFRGMQGDPFVSVSGGTARGSFRPLRSVFCIVKASPGDRLLHFYDYVLLRTVVEHFPPGASMQEHRNLWCGADPSSDGTWLVASATPPFSVSMGSPGTVFRLYPPGY